MASTPALPGLNLPVNHYPNGLLPNALRTADFNLDLITLREVTMMKFMDRVTNKPAWNTKVFDEIITGKWKKEALASSTFDISGQMIDYCLDELKLKAKVFEATGGVSVIDGDVSKSDILISEDLRQALETACKPLEEIPDVYKDWHPGCENKVLDLVHPSLFPLIYGRSRILEGSTAGIDDCIRRSGDGRTVPSPPDRDTVNNAASGKDLKVLKAWSSKYQWLPCDVDFCAEDMESVKLTSYINNLHPKDFAGLYGIISQIIAKAIPLWNLSLTGLKKSSGLKRRIKYTEVAFSFDEARRPLRAAGESADDFQDRLDEFLFEDRVYHQPEPGTYMRLPQLSENGQIAWSTSASQLLIPPEDYAVNLRRDFAQTGLQVIVKLANIHLTPSSPEYNGGSWHVEGQLNEHICATAIYYYSSHNITTSTLSFRKRGDVDASSVKIDYEQHDYRWLEVIFGLRDVMSEGGASTATQELGDVETRQGRLITFPNIYQHRVDAFQLEDQSQPGHRKILALFLVDPNIKIISTANVPSQRKDWWGRELREREDMGNLPPELQDYVVDAVEGFPIGMDEAKRIRLDLMGERSTFLDEHDEAFEGELAFSLCEH